MFVITLPFSLLKNSPDGGAKPSASTAAAAGGGSEGSFRRRLIFFSKSVLYFSFPWKSGSFGWIRWQLDATKVMEREAKKEAFRKYLESSGVLDALTKVLVALYEENHKPSSALEFVQQKLGGRSISDYEKLQAEKSDLQMKYDELVEAHRETCRQLEELQNLKISAHKDFTDGDKTRDGL